MRSVVALASAMCLLVGAACAEEPQAGGEAVDLAWKFVAGQTLVYEVTMSGSGTQSTRPEAARVDISTRFDLAQRVLEVYSDGSAEVEMTSSGLTAEMRIESEGQTHELKMRLTKDEFLIETPTDRRRLSPEEFGLGAVSPISAPLKMRIGKRGEMLACSHEGLAQLSQLLGGVECSRMMRPAETPFPDRPVAPGESWDYTRKLVVPDTESEVESAVTARLERVEDIKGTSTAVISQRGAVDVSDIAAEVPGAEGGPPASVTVEKMAQATEGAVEFALDEGRLIRATYDTDTSTEMRVPVPEMAGVFRKIQSQMKIRVEMNLKEVRG